MKQLAIAFFILISIYGAGCGPIYDDIIVEPYPYYDIDSLTLQKFLKNWQLVSCVDEEGHHYLEEETEQSLSLMSYDSIYPGSFLIEDRGYYSICPSGKGCPNEGGWYVDTLNKNLYLESYAYYYNVQSAEYQLTDSSLQLYFYHEQFDKYFTIMYKSE